MLSPGLGAGWAAFRHRALSNWQLLLGPRAGHPLASLLVHAGQRGIGVGSGGEGSAAGQGGGAGLGVLRKWLVCSSRAQRDP